MLEQSVALPIEQQTSRSLPAESAFDLAGFGESVSTPADCIDETRDRSPVLRQDRKTNGFNPP